MAKEIRKIGSFVAMGEDGMEHTIHIFTDILDAGTRADTNAELEGLKELRTQNGDAVNRLGKGKYEIVVTGAILQSDEPDAP